jgi:hypothetical protein
MDSATLVFVLSKLKSFERMQWQELLRGGSHNVRAADLVKSAQDRLAVLSLDDYDEIYSLRLSGTQRLYGIKDKGVLRFIWWDPDHKIYETKLKHT